MKIVYDPRFSSSLNEILDYISLDSQTRAMQFQKNLKQKIEDLVKMPYMCRKSIHFEGENIRDLVFKGYAVVYNINESKEIIIIYGIKKYRENF